MASRVPAAARAGRRSPDAEAAATSQVLWLVLLALVAAVYFVIRFGGRWADGDTGIMTQAIRDVALSGQLAPDSPALYPNGYGYQAVAAMIIAFTGLSPQELQQVVRPLLSVTFVVPAWVLFRELAGSARLATLATLLLLLVPEHLFTVLRGSHEVLTRALMLGALWLLVRANRHRHEPSRYTVFLSLSLAATFAVMTINVVFGAALVAAVATALAGGWLIGRLARPLRMVAARATPQLGWYALAGTLLGAMFVLFLYWPAQHTVRALSLIPAALFGGSSGFDPYAYIGSGWIDTTTYVALSVGNFLLLGGSALVWLWLGWSWLRRGERPAYGVWLAWLLYAAFAAQVAISLVADRAGLLGGNFQIRAIPMLAVLAVVLIAVAADRWRPSIRGRTVATFGLALLAVAAMLKASNEPALSNRWGFYTEAELRGLSWADTHLRLTDTWVGPDDRLAAAYMVAVGRPTSGNRWDVGEPVVTARALFVSDVLRAQAARLGETLPALGSMNIVYDGGTSQLYLARSWAAFDR